MNKLFAFGAALSIAAFFGFSACSDDETEIPATVGITINVQVENPKGFTGLTSGQSVFLTNTEDNKTYVAITDENGVATFSDMIPNVYSISTSWKISSEKLFAAYEKDTIVQSGNYLISGSVLNATITSEEIVEVPTTWALKQSLLISKVYHAGSKDNNNKNYIAGSFIELYNNGDESVDIAGYYLALSESNATPAYILKGENASENATQDFVYVKQIFRFPNEGHHELQPGEHIVIANSAINHQTSAANDFDLSAADFEAKDEKGKLTNNSDVPALELLYTAFPAISNMNLTKGGPASVVIFKTDEDVTAWEEVYADGKTSGTLQKKMPSKYIIDGVDILKYKNDGTVNADYKRLWDFIDAGFTNIKSVGGNDSQVNYRKLEKLEDGRAVLKDSNNSSEDWDVSTVDNQIIIGQYR